MRCKLGLVDHDDVKQDLLAPVYEGISTAEVATRSFSMGGMRRGKGRSGSWGEMVALPSRLCLKVMHLGFFYNFFSGQTHGPCDDILEMTLVLPCALHLSIHCSRFEHQSRFCQWPEKHPPTSCWPREPNWSSCSNRGACSF